MSLSKVSILLTSAGLLLAACGGDGAEETGAPGVGAKPRGAAADGQIGNRDPETSVAALNDAEWKAACFELGEALDERELAQASCVLAGLLGKAVGVDCKLIYDMCVGQPPVARQCDAKPANCSATLRELDACGISQLLWLADQTRGLDCSSSVDVFARIDQTYVTPECQAVSAKCPSFALPGAQDADESF